MKFLLGVLVGGLLVGGYLRPKEKEPSSLDRLDKLEEETIAICVSKLMECTEANREFAIEYKELSRTCGAGKNVITR